jgi:hypothetical protein
MSKVDWSLAPAAATHAGTFKDLFTCWYWLDDRSQWRYASDLSDTWEKVVANKPISDLVERPKSNQWSGPQDGLPPVNTEYEVSTDHGAWEHCTVLAHGYDDFKPHAVVQCASGLWMEEVTGFRAIKTPDQLAADKRETAIRELMDVVGIDCRVTAGKAVDAGFKREVV